MAKKTEASGKSQETSEANMSGPKSKADMTKVDGVRRALAAGKVLPGDGTDYMMNEFGIHMTREQFSTTKSQLKRRAGKAKGKPGRKPKATIEGYLAPPAKRSAGGETELIAAMEAMKPLVSSLGVERVKRLADLLG